MEKDFVVKGYLYENINDNAQNFYKKIGSALTRSTPLAGNALKTFIDLVGDVVIAAKNNIMPKRKKLYPLSSGG